jgi:hypothetical protein
MQMHVVFEDDPDWKALSIARLLADLQHLAIFIYISAEGKLSDEFSVLNLDEQKYESMIVADDPDEVSAHPPLEKLALHVFNLHLGSPLSVIAGVLHPAHLKTALTKVGKAIAHLVLVDLRRERMRYENEIIRQRAITAYLKNMKELKKILSEMKNEDERRLFLKHFAYAIDPLVSGKYSELTKFDIS